MWLLLYSRIFLLLLFFLLLLLLFLLYTFRLALKNSKTIGRTKLILIHMKAYINGSGQITFRTWSHHWFLRYAHKRKFLILSISPKLLITEVWDSSMLCIRSISTFFITNSKLSGRVIKKLWPYLEIFLISSISPLILKLHWWTLITIVWNVHLRFHLTILDIVKGYSHMPK